MIRRLWSTRGPQQCTEPVCRHVTERYATPAHLDQQRCEAVTWWVGCVAWMAGRCACIETCAPRRVHGPGQRRCACPEGALLALT